MNQFRQLLKQSIAVPHKRLEDLAVMKVYSSGNASLSEYVAVTERLHYFWVNHRPSTDRLPPQFQQFYISYISALSKDVGKCASASAKFFVNEIAFFYVLLGSGLGAQIIRKRYENNPLPKSNIDHLAQNSGPLWKTFNAEHLSTVPGTEYTTAVNDAHALFNSLYNNIVKI